MSKDIKLNNNKIAIVDDEDFERIKNINWYCYESRHRDGKFYVRANASRNNGPEAIILHRLIMNASKKDQVDHIDGNPLNNQKSNLRLCSHAENMRNRNTFKNNQLGLKGVKLASRCTNRWIARICVNKKLLHLGTFASPEEASQAYKEAAKKYFGEFARV